MRTKLDRASQYLVFSVIVVAEFKGKIGQGDLISSFLCSSCLVCGQNWKVESISIFSQ